MNTLLLSSVVAQIQDTTAAAHPSNFAPVDSVVVESPLPAGVATVVRFLMNNVPPWMQIGGMVLGAIVGLIIVYLMFHNREMIFTWLKTRTRTYQWALGIALVVMAAGAATAGALTWNYTQHSNDFCTGCHVMNPAFQKFSSIENKHSKLSCHDCHQQPITASLRQLYFWVAERPADIKAHSKVPNDVCAKCHITQDTAKWQRIATTAGHRVHLESDSSVLEGVQCVKCHGLDVHQFQPVDKTCGQTDCHSTKDTKIVLGKMASQTALHCTGCHPFTADVPALATRDSAAGTMVPGKAQCLGCHEMSKVMKDFNEGKDPHGGKCGTCHNPHTQKTPAAAAETCASAGCHDNWKDNPFHAGPKHKKFGEQCLICHQPHASKIDASDCEGCHLRVRTKGLLRPPLPYDTSAALRRSRVDTAASAAAPSSMHSLPVTPAAVQWKPSHDNSRRQSGDNDQSLESGGDVAFDDGAGSGPWAGDEAAANPIDDGWDSGWPDDGAVIEPPPTVPAPAKADSFPHARHTKLACLECHKTGSGHGDLRFVAPRGCAICHHQSPKTAKCETCHQNAKYGAAKPATVTVTVAGRQPKPRTVQFLHGQHTKNTCVECHTTPVTLAASVTKATCKDCHTDHHAQERNCVSCHNVTEPKVGHTTLATAHQGCDGCHNPTTVALLTPTRSLCGACHAAKLKDHYDAKECSTCHFLAPPAAYKSKLMTASRP